jgi:hypothetical protein
VSEVFLGLIAVAVLTMAVIQIAAIVFALRAARRVGDAVSRFERTMEPIVANLQTITADATRATSIATAQVERATRMMTDLSRRVDETAAAVQASIVGPAREGYAIFQGILAALAVFRAGAGPAAKRQPSADEEDALFIG